MPSALVPEPLKPGPTPLLPPRGWVAFSWLDDWKPVEVPPLPVAGARELHAIRRRWAKQLTALAQARVLVTCQQVMACLHHGKKHGPAIALRLWQKSVPSIVEGEEARGQLLAWTEADVMANLELYATEKVYPNLGVTDADAAAKEIKKRADAIEADFDATTTEEMMMESLVVELWWRFRGVTKTLKGPDGPLDFTRENIALVASYPDDYERLYQAVHRASSLAKSGVSEINEAFDLVTEEVVLGNSENSSAPSTASPPSSASTSTPTTGQPSEPKLSAARSG